MKLTIQCIVSQLLNSNEFLKFYSSAWLLNTFDMFIEFRTIKNTWSAKVTFYTVLLQIHSSNCLQKNCNAAPQLD